MFQYRGGAAPLYPIASSNTNYGGAALPTIGAAFNADHGGAALFPGAYAVPWYALERTNPYFKADAEAFALALRKMRAWQPDALDVPVDTAPGFRRIAGHMDSATYTALYAVVAGAIEASAAADHLTSQQWCMLVSALIAVYFLGRSCFVEDPR